MPHSPASPIFPLGFEFAKKADYENGFYLTVATADLAKSIAHYEIYQKIVNILGEIVECGVFRGASLMRFAAYREMLETPYARKIIGFDAFGKFPATVTSADDKQFIAEFERESGEGISLEALEEVLRYKGIVNIELIKGDILDTLPDFGAQSTIKIELLHLDLNVYEATKAGLDFLYDKVVTGGVIVFNDYGTARGATQAIDKLLASQGDRLVLQKLPYSNLPAYAIKGYCRLN